MSDQSQGPGWWMASDARWYPPQGPVPPPPPPPPVFHPSPPMNGCLKAGLIGMLLLIGLGVLGTALGEAGDDDTPSATATTGGSTGASDRDATTTTDREATIEDDVTLLSCNAGEFGGMGAQLEVLNNSSERSNYSIDVAFESLDGTEQLASGSAYVSGLEPGQRTTEDASAFEDPPPGGYNCEVQDVTRYSDE